MSIVGFKGRNHPQQTAKRGADDTVDDRETGPDTFAECVERWGPFTLDVAAAPHNAKCDRFYTLQDDALEQSWHGEHVWCNPPYSGLEAWLAKAWAEWNILDFRCPRCRASFSLPLGTNCDAHEPRRMRPLSITLLLPANRTEQAWWQDHVEPFRDRPGSQMTTHYLRGRRRFIQAGATEIKPNERPPFGLVVVHYSEPQDQR